MKKSIFKMAVLLFLFGVSTSYLFASKSSYAYNEARYNNNETINDNAMAESFHARRILGKLNHRNIRFHNINKRLHRMNHALREKNIKIRMRTRRIGMENKKKE